MVVQELQGVQAVLLVLGVHSLEMMELLVEQQAQGLRARQMPRQQQVIPQDTFRRVAVGVAVQVSEQWVMEAHQALMPPLLDLLVGQGLILQVLTEHLQQISRLRFLKGQLVVVAAAAALIQGQLELEALAAMGRFRVAAEEVVVVVEQVLVPLVEEEMEAEV